MKIYCGDELLWSRVVKANNPFTRFLGLMGRRSLSQDEGLLIIPCRQVHSFYMRFPIDVVFLSKQMQVLYIMTLIPGKVSPLVEDAACVLEVSQGSAEEFIKPGDMLIVEGKTK